MTPQIRRKVFVSYHHGGDRQYYDWFVQVFGEGLQIVHDHSVERQIRSESAEYVIRRIRERYLTGASATVVLCGLNTWGRKYVDWEILASLNQHMGLVGLILPTNPKRPGDIWWVPNRLADNVRSGYAVWEHLATVAQYPQMLGWLLEQTLSRSTTLIRNDCGSLDYDSPLCSL
jgi:hypothetical protein